MMSEEMWKALRNRIAVTTAERPFSTKGLRYSSDVAELVQEIETLRAEAVEAEEAIVTLQYDLSHAAEVVRNSGAAFVWNVPASMLKPEDKK